VAYVPGIVGAVALGAWVSQLIDLKDYSAATVFRRLSLNFLVTFALALITEEGFLPWRVVGKLRESRIFAGHHDHLDERCLRPLASSRCRSSIRISRNL
jgi:hypothetical protein